MCEKARAVALAKRLAATTNEKSPLAKAIEGWLKANQAHLGLNNKVLQKKFLKAFKKAKRAKTAGSKSAFMWARTLEVLDNLDGNYSGEDADNIAENVKTLGASLDLSPLEASVFEDFLRIKRGGVFSSLCYTLISTTGYTPNEVLANAAGVTPQDIEKVLFKGALNRLGLVQTETNAKYWDFQFFIPYSVRMAVHFPAPSPGGIEGVLLGKRARSTLGWKDFDFLDPERTAVTGLIKEAVAQKEAGVNILLFGPPGNGKTEFCKVLAGRLGFKLYSVGEDDEGDEPDRYDRLSALQLAQQIGSKRDKTFLLFDEVDDLMGDGLFSAASGNYKSRAGSKIFYNRLLENNPVPTLWVTNSIHCLDVAFLRRMTFALEVKNPPIATRKRLWSRVLKREGLAKAKFSTDGLAKNYEISPALMVNAARFTRLSKGNEDTLRLAVDALSTAVHYGRRKGFKKDREVAFDVSLINAGEDIEGLIEKLKKSKNSNFSFCLYGPPGTGKSAFLRYLAGELGYDTLEKRASDILSSWIGESEQNIANAFKAAEDSGQFLIFEEADSLLSDRRRSIRSWEVSQVNEMLTWMEDFPYPFACTTNLIERIDTAAFRRFTFKIALDYLTEDQVRRAFQVYFGVKAPGNLRQLNALTPGDFYVVSQKMKIFGKVLEREEIAGLLEKENALKPDHFAKVGF